MDIMISPRCDSLPELASITVSTFWRMHCSTVNSMRDLDISTRLAKNNSSTDQHTPECSHRRLSILLHFLTVFVQKLDEISFLFVPWSNAQKLGVSLCLQVSFQHSIGCWRECVGFSSGTDHRGLDSADQLGDLFIEPMNSTKVPDFLRNNLQIQPCPVKVSFETISVFSWAWESLPCQKLPTIEQCG